MATSSIPRIKTALLTAMQTALPTLNTASRVTWAHPGAAISKEAVFMGDAFNISENVAALRVAPHQHDERYVIPVWVDVLSEGNDAQSSEERMWTIIGSIENALRADPTISATAGLISAVIGDGGEGGEGKHPENYQTDGAWASRCMVSVKIHARI